MPVTAGTPGSQELQPQLSQGQAELLAQVHMAKNNRAAHAGSSAPAVSAVQLSQALQNLPGAGISAHSSAPAVQHISKAATGTMSAPTQQVPSQSTTAGPTAPPAASLQKQLPVTPTRNRNVPSSPRPKGKGNQPLAQQQLTQQASSLSLASSAQQLSAATLEKAASNNRIMIELASWHQQSQQQQQQLVQRLVREQMLHTRQQQQRPSLPEASAVPAAAPPASIAHTAQNSSSAAMQQPLAAVQAVSAAQGRPALPAITSGAVGVRAQQRPPPAVSSSHQGVPAMSRGAITNTIQQRPTLGVSSIQQGSPAASMGAVRLVPQQRPTLLVSSHPQGASSHGVVTGQLPNSAPAGQPVNSGPARFPAPFQPPALRPSGPRPQYFAAASTAQPAARPPGSATQPPQLHASPAGLASRPISQQHVPGTHPLPSQTPPSTGVAAKGQAYPVYVFYPDGTTPHSQQQGIPHGQSTATTAVHLPQSQPAASGVVARAVANMQARAAGPAAGQHPALAQITGQKRAAEPVNAQDANAAKQPRTYSAQTPLQQLLQPMPGQLALPAAAQTRPPALGMPAPAAPSTELAFVEALMVIPRPTSATSELLHKPPFCARPQCCNAVGSILKD